MLLAGGCCVVNLASTGRGGQPPAQGAVVVAMETKFEPMPLASTLVGEADELAKAVAQHVAKRTHLQCVVTASLPEHATRAQKKFACGWERARACVSSRGVSAA